MLAADLPKTFQTCRVFHGRACIIPGNTKLPLDDTVLVPIASSQSTIDSMGIKLVTHAQKSRQGLYHSTQQGDPGALKACELCISKLTASVIVELNT